MRVCADLTIGITKLYSHALLGIGWTTQGGFDAEVYHNGMAIVPTLGRGQSTGWTAITHRQTLLTSDLKSVEQMMDNDVAATVAGS